MSTRSQQILAGVQGFTSGSNGIVNLDLNKRFFGLQFEVATGSTPTLTAISSVFNWVQLTVNGTVMIDWTPQMFTESYRWDGLTNKMQTGQLYIPFSLPPFRGFRDCDVTSYDLAGQVSATLTFSLQTGLTSPAILGLQEFDFNRNLVQRGANAGQPFVRALKRVRQSFTIAGSASGLGSSTDITQIPINYPIRRLILIPDNPGTLSHYEVWADGSIVDQGDLVTGSTNSWVNNGLARQIAYGEGANYASYANAAAITYPLPSIPLDFTYSGKLKDALTCKNSLLLRVWSTYAGTQNLQIAQEFIAYAYK